MVLRLIRKAAVALHKAKRYKVLELAVQVAMRHVLPCTHVLPCANPCAHLPVCRAQYDADELSEAKRTLTKALHLAPTDAKLRFDVAVCMQASLLYIWGHAAACPTTSAEQLRACIMSAASCLSWIPHTGPPCRRRVHAATGVGSAHTQQAAATRRPNKV